MSLKQRRILYIFFIFLFLIISPLISLYAAGYKVNFRAGKIQKTGTLIIKTSPKQARIYLNGQLQKKNWQKFWLKENILTTPTKIGHLLPGQYEIILKKQNYWPWRRQVNLLPGQSINLENILLFKKDLPYLLFSVRADRLYPSIDKKTALAIGESNCFLLDLEKNTQKKILTVHTANPPTVAWSYDSKKVIIDYILFEIDENKKINLKPFFLPVLKTSKKTATSTLNLVKNIRFSQTDNNLFYFSVGSDFYSFDIEKLKPKKIISVPFLQDAIVKKDYIAAIKSINTKSEIDFYSLANTELLRTISLPFSQNYTFIHPNNNLLNLYDQSHHILYLINPQALLPLVETIKNIALSVWQDEKLLYANDFEVWVYNASNRQKKLVTRLSQPIKAIFWHPAQKHIFLSTANKLFITELFRDHYQNINPLISFEKISNPFLSANKKEIIFSGQIGAQAGIYKLKINE